MFQIIDRFAGVIESGKGGEKEAKAKLKEWTQKGDRIERITFDNHIFFVIFDYKGEEFGIVARVEK